MSFIAHVWVMLMSLGIIWQTRVYSSTVKVFIFVGTNFRGFGKRVIFVDSWFRGFPVFALQLLWKFTFRWAPNFLVCCSHENHEIWYPTNNNAFTVSAESRCHIFCLHVKNTICYSRNLFSRRKVRACKAWVNYIGGYNGM